MLKAITISFSLSTGGAGIAADKFRRILSENSSDYQVDSITQDKAGKAQLFKRLISYGLSKFQFDGNPIKHSLNLFTFKPVLDSFYNHDVLHHLHWLNNDTLSIFDFHKIPPGSIITLHDEWLYCGSEHLYKLADKSNDFSDKYTFFKKGVIGIHWNYFIWNIKYKKLAQRDDLIYTVPSTWMLERAKSSSILKTSDIRLLPNPINSDVFKPLTEQKIITLRTALDIDNDTFVILYCSTASSNKLKGTEVLKKALDLLRSKDLNFSHSKITLVDFGGQKAESKLSGFRNISTGFIDDSSYLAQIYSIADCVIVPSMIESFGQVAAEALSCSTPVICFDTSGLKDIVIHKYNGLVASTFSEKSLCDQIIKMIELNKQERQMMGQKARDHILKNFSYPIVTEKYLKVLHDAIMIKKTKKIKKK